MAKNVRDKVTVQGKNTNNGIFANTPNILLTAVVVVLLLTGRHKSVISSGIHGLKSSVEVLVIKHRSLTSTRSHSMQGHVVVGQRDPTEFPISNRYSLPHGLLV